MPYVLWPEKLRNVCDASTQTDGLQRVRIANEFLLKYANYIDVNYPWLQYGMTFLSHTLTHTLVSHLNTAAITHMSTPNFIPIHIHMLKHTYMPLYPHSHTKPITHFHPIHCNYLNKIIMPHSIMMASRPFND